ncbi:single-stranded DNA-binding protein [Actinomadura verrucosospora]|uniref:Single-stranded DNA-binding protein n=1 Tax=Actinomadura verrucosospora TaxID=46165 RepID=A0A7D3W0D5_ACTVE|nr:single-stranded DNA-binding protein [Actinomadura verrucosospora]QKG27310.1 Single-stranded DNA-binding protein [Actinomadura verrucosospora]
MSVGETTITIVGNLTADPDLRFTQTGVGVAAFTVASTPRFYDQQAGEWKDGDALFLRCSAWRHLAEHVAETLTRGMRVIVTGRLRQRNYEDKEGIKRTAYEIEVDDVGPSLRYATAKVAKATRQQAPHPATANGTNGAASSNGGGFGQPSADPWLNGGTGGQHASSSEFGGGSGGGFSDDPPF